MLKSYENLYYFSQNLNIFYLYDCIFFMVLSQQPDSNQRVHIIEIQFLYVTCYLFGYENYHIHVRLLSLSL